MQNISSLEILDERRFCRGRGESPIFDQVFLFFLLLTENLRFSRIVVVIIILVYRSGRRPEYVFFFFFLYVCC